MKLALLVCAAIVVLLPASASGGSTNSLPLSFGNTQGTHINASLDTPQPPDGHYATNNTGCAWLDEDEVFHWGGGALNAGQTVTDALCLVADLDGPPDATYPKLVIARVYVPKTAGTISLSISNDAGDSWTDTTAPVVYGNQLIYQMCVKDAVADRGNIFSWRNLQYWPLVSGTTGYGQIVHYTVQVVSPAKTIRGVAGYFSATFNGFYGTTFRPEIQTLPGGEVPCPSA